MLVYGVLLSGRIIHLELDRVGGMFEVVYFLPLELHIGIYKVVAEHISFFEEVAVGVERFHRLAQ